ncbi:MAG: DUF4139 domain-containing protein [Oscillospiraceae bacterium]|nr:DUF4139 domain-containing protein [Oscillospiraceae bacterium]
MFKSKRILSLFLALLTLAVMLPSGGIYGAATDIDIYDAFENELSEARESFFNSYAPEAMDLEVIEIDTGGLKHQPPIIIEPDPPSEGVAIERFYAPSPPSGIGATRTFKDVGTGRLIGQGVHTNIWVLASESRISTELANKAATEFDEIYKRMTGDSGFGAHANVVINTEYGSMPVVGDIDGDGRVNFVFYSMSSGGFFSNGDFFNGSYNELDMVNVNISYWNSILTNNTEANWLSMYNTMAHEFQHLLFYMYFGVNAPSGYSWLNESLSELAGTFFPKPGAEIAEFGRLLSASQNSYANSGYGDFINFNNSLKNYGMVKLFSMLMYKSYTGYTKNIYNHMIAAYPAGSRAANQTKITTDGHDKTASGLLFAGTGLGDGSNTLSLAYYLFMESFAADGGTIRSSEPANAKKLYDASNPPDNLWAIRPVVGTSDGRVYLSGTSGLYYTVNGSAYSSIPTLASGGAITLRGYSNGADATHEMLYKLNTAEGSPILTITAPNDGNAGTLYYAVIPNDPTEIGSNGADVYPLTKGSPVTVNSHGRGAYLFVSTLRQNVSSSVTYSWSAPLNDNDSVAADKSQITWNRIRNQNTEQSWVISNLSLPTSGGNGSSISWSSNNAAVSSSGVVTRPAAGSGDAAVTLTATISKGSASDTVVFTLTVPQAKSDADSVAEDLEWLTWDIIRNANSTTTSIMSNLSLPSIGGAEGSAIAWISVPAGIISSTGTITRPESDTEVVLTAAISKGVSSDSKNFNLTVKAKGSGGGLIVPSLNSAGVFINLTDETIETSGFTVAAYSVDGGNKWKKGALPSGDKFAKLFNKDMELWISDKWNAKAVKEGKTVVQPKGVPENASIVKFPKINKRPRAERLVPYFPQSPDNIWYPVKKGETDAVTGGFEYANTSNGKTPDGDGWQPLSAGYAVNNGKAKTTYLVRSAPNPSNGEYAPASKAIKIKPANYGKVPNIKINQKKGIITLKAGFAYAVGDGNFTVVGEKTELSIEGLAGATVRIKKAATGKKPASAVQTLSVPGA